MRIIDGAECTDEQRRALAVALINAFGSVYPAWTVEEAVGELQSQESIPRSVVALVDGTAVGCASLLDDDEVAGWDGRFWLGNVLVIDGYRGGGIGSALVAAVESMAVQLGVGELHLVTDSAIDWHERHGWTVCDSALVHGHPMTVMRKQLRSIAEASTP